MRDFLSHSAFTNRAAHRMLRHRSHAPNSLFWKILPVTPLDPRFWQATPASGQRNSNESKILQIPRKKNRVRVVPVPKPTAPLCAAVSPVVNAFLNVAPLASPKGLVGRGLVGWFLAHETLPAEALASRFRAADVYCVRHNWPAAASFPGVAEATSGPTGHAQRQSGESNLDRSHRNHRPAEGSKPRSNADLPRT